MDVKFSVALDSPAQQRDFEVARDDDFRVVVDIYSTDATDDIDTIDLTGSTLTFELPGYPSQSITAIGNVFTFAPFPANQYRRPRAPYRIYMVDADGLKTTLIFGYMVTRRRGLLAWFWPSGADYGWRA
ncbi:hypothetical protein G3N58_15110 [Paraburkholderia sp. Ac-20342]|uniref:hypothetical protein n=1 Tax=Paraburkholderia sp. Ac-20342 TaxID=2703889 RepID=UPI0019812269|nr:hypothetical protein [Paraburkholderia sp. Ac-20342]MBN3848149.1 hypothetical protein [Paraburkholderia sp. Ac-20342]